MVSTSSAALCPDASLPETTAIAEHDSAANLPDADHIGAAPGWQARWQARLTLGFADDAGTTRLIERHHVGPLRVQKALYPEGPAICHAIIVHPPGGVVGGDSLMLKAAVGSGAHVLIATPGAAKWYKAGKANEPSRQHVNLDVNEGGKLDYLPQETLFFDAADVRLSQSVTLAFGACYIGCDILCFGRTASGETFNRGKVTQNTSIRQEGKLVWWEQGMLVGASSAMHSKLGLRGNTVCATLLAAGWQKPVAPDVLQAMRQEVAAICNEGNADNNATSDGGNSNGNRADNSAGDFGISQLKTVLVVRYLGDSSEVARRVMLCVWRYLRPELMQCAAFVPRIWNT